MEQLLIQIPKELLSPSETAHYEGELKLDRMMKGDDEYAFITPVSWSADITNTGNALLVTGIASADMRTVCARCLEPADMEIDGEIEGYFIIDPQSVSSADQEDEEFDILPDDKRIDMAPLIRAAILLELPLVPVCRQDCKGLCSECGANLNEGECGCSRGSSNDSGEIGANNPFGVLADLDL